MLRREAEQAANLGYRLKSGRKRMHKQVIHTDKVPPARVPLSQAIKAGDWIFVSGQLGNDPRTRRLAEGGIGPETRQVCENLKAAAEAAGGTMDDICRVDVYIRNMEQFEAIHKVRREYFREPLPASTMVEVVKMTRPDYLIEISAIAVIP
jgi:2-iminobutanoate/2-iminopropanoate deaminase